jgi:hypothetical protein
MMLTPFFDVRTPRGLRDLGRARLAVLFGLVVAGGCGNPDMGRVSGRITNGGKPVANAMVVFYTPSRPVARGMTDADGRFTLSTRRLNDGAYAGSHKVSVNPTFSGPDAAAPESGGGLVPANVHDLSNTPLETEVRAGVMNTCEFDITSTKLPSRKGSAPK